MWFGDISRSHFKVKVIDDCVLEIRCTNFFITNSSCVIFKFASSLALALASILFLRFLSRPVHLVISFVFLVHFRHFLPFLFTRIVSTLSNGEPIRNIWLKYQTRSARSIRFCLLFAIQFRSNSLTIGRFVQHSKRALLFISENRFFGRCPLFALFSARRFSSPLITIAMLIHFARRRIRCVPYENNSQNLHSFEDESYFFTFFRPAGSTRFLAIFFFNFFFLQLYMFTFDLIIILLARRMVHV